MAEGIQSLGLGVGPATQQPERTDISPTIGTVYQPSTTQWAHIVFAGSITTSFTLVGGSEAYLVVESASDPGMTTNLHEEGRLTNGQTGALGVGLAINQKQGATFSFWLRPGYYWRVRQVNVSVVGGAPTSTLTAGTQLILG